MRRAVKSNLLNQPRIQLAARKFLSFRFSVCKLSMREPQSPDLSIKRFNGGSQFRPIINTLIQTTLWYTQERMRIENVNPAFSKRDARRALASAPKLNNSPQWDERVSANSIELFLVLRFGFENRGCPPLFPSFLPPPPPSLFLSHALPSDMRPRHRGGN